MKKEQHKITLPIIRYRDDGDNPTCAIDFTEGDVCVYYRTQRYGTNETCVFAENSNGKFFPQMQRRDDGQGTLIPGSWCPVWTDKN